MVFFLGLGHNNFSGLLFIATLLGISLVIASGCVFNNYIDRDIDKIMQRTKNRVLAKELLSNNFALTYAVVLGVLGTLVLYLFTNILATSLALIGLFFYVVIYSLWFKRNSIYATLIGSISGAIPPVVGYCATTNYFDIGAVILFLMLSVWQMPHSFAIAIYRFNDYKNASIPILPVKKGFEIAKIHMLFYVVLFSILSIMLSIFGYTGRVYFFVSSVIGVCWIYLACLGFNSRNLNKWARKMFIFSILSLMILAITMSLDVVR